MFKKTTMGLVLAAMLGAAACTPQQAMRPDVPKPVPVDVDQARPTPAPQPVATPQRTQATISRAELAKHRAQQIERLKAYADAGVFPRNNVSRTLVNVLRDDDGRLCAVANMIHLDGKDDILDAAVKTNNFMKIAEQNEGDMHAWVLGSGLTVEEVAFIQAPYMPARPDADFEKLERERLQAHFKVAIKMLEEDTEKSLDLAMARLDEAKPASVTATRAFATPPGV